MGIRTCVTKWRRWHPFCTQHSGVSQDSANLFSSQVQKWLSTMVQNSFLSTDGIQMCWMSAGCEVREKLARLLPQTVQWKKTSLSTEATNQAMGETQFESATFMPQSTTHKALKTFPFGLIQLVLWSSQAMNSQWLSSAI